MSGIWTEAPSDGARPGVRAVIQCAMDVEAAPFLETLAPGAATREVGALGRRRQSFTAGELDGSTVLVVTAGIGLANAAAAAARALMMVDPGIVIAAGTTGGLGREVEVGDVIAGTATTFSSADATAFGYARGQIPQMPVDHRSDELTVRRAVDLGHRVGQTVRVGQVLSSDSFVTAANVGTTREEFPDALATDMETAAMAQVSWSVGVDWVSLRAVSDLCGPRADQDFHMDSARAARLSYQAVRAFLSL
ncbi:5'-methylthioadenosine/S-adenosylhomocysteine nucleosidase [Schaalia naturae]|uniref:adenosylhomocysteine nucleosidase n=1 Tax=Schaalia naturae TaxID=635203 RepID=A0ABW2SQV4_9ACTO